MSIGLAIVLDGDGAFPEMADKPLGRVIKISRLPRGTTKGRAAVAIQIQLPDGTLVLGETALSLLLVATKAFRSAEERDGVTYEE